MLSFWNLQFFSPEELLSPGGLRQLYRGNLMMDIELMQTLELWRSDIERAILINLLEAGHLRRGYRSPKENVACGGKEFSRHVQGVAVDVTIPGWTVAEVAESAEKVGFTFIKLYAEKNFCHCDFRPIIRLKEEGRCLLN